MSEPKSLRDTVEALRKLEAEATPGPWHREMLDLGNGTMTLGIGSKERAVCIVSGIVESPVGLRDVALVAATRNALPALLAAAERLLELEQKIEFVAQRTGGRFPLNFQEIDGVAAMFGWQSPSAVSGEGRTE